MALSSKSFRVSSPNRKIQDVPDVTPTITAVSDGAAAGTAAFNELRVSVSANVVTGGIPDAYRVVSTPGNIVAVGGSPVSVRGLTPGTSYTFTATPQTSAGTLGTASIASSAETPTGAYSLIYDFVVTSTDAGGQYIFTQIPQTYQDLKIIIHGRYTRNAQFEDAIVGWGFISDYSSTFINGNGSSASSSRNTSQPSIVPSFVMPAATSTTGIFGYLTIDLFNYANPNVNKTAIVRVSGDINGSGNAYAAMFLRRNVAPATYLEFNGGFSGLAAGSRVTIYGIKAAS